MTAADYEHIIKYMADKEGYFYTINELSNILKIERHIIKKNILKALKQHLVLEHTTKNKKKIYTFNYGEVWAY